jgi:hypothetical protein
MRDDEIDDGPELPANDPVSAMLERLDSTEDFGAPEESQPPAPALNRRDLDELVDQILDDELQRISERRG